MESNTQSNNIDNAFCLIAGEHRSPYFMHPIVNNILSSIFNFCNNHSENKLCDFILHHIVGYYWHKLGFWFVPYINIGTGIYFYNGAYGNIITIGFLGKKSLQGVITGGFEQSLILFTNNFLGVIGFTGFNIMVPVFDDDYPDANVIFFGSALAVNLIQE
jgi:hypothetical protein